MPSDDQKQRRIRDLAIVAFAEVMKRNPQGSSLLQAGFRCPKDGSTMTQKIQEILDAATTSVTIDGKTVAVEANSVLLNRYRPGKRPRTHFEFILISLLFLLCALVALGQFQGGPALLYCAIMLLLGGGAFAVFLDSRKKLQPNMAQWKDRLDAAEHQWHCHQCGKPFDPQFNQVGSDAPSLDGLTQEEPVEGDSKAENVRPLLSNASSPDRH